MATLLVLLGFVVLPLGCEHRSDGGDLLPAPVRNATSSWGSFYVTYQPRPDPIPLNEVFSLEVAVAPAADHAQPAADTAIAVDARMPEHSHGMNLAPTVTKVGEGKFRVDGMLFHMPGRWELYVDVTRAAEMERATFVVALD